ncbi:DUF202 domain-containing protein [Streptacidiphilus sp. PB12-B1b]|nr:DUF202 domain-containing protein [Streptacidiphilus sp. PB12-B1b]
MAAERTFLAWVRTCLALMAGGAALCTLPGLPHRLTRTAIGILCILAAGLLAGMAHRDWSRVRRSAMGDPLTPGPHAAVVLTAAVMSACLALALPAAARVLFEEGRSRPAGPPVITAHHRNEISTQASTSSPRPMGLVRAGL